MPEKKRSLVAGVEAVDAHLYTPGIKRIGDPIEAIGGFLKPSKVARYTVTDLLPDDEQGKAKWRGNPNDTYSDWTIEIIYEKSVETTVLTTTAESEGAEAATTTTTTEDAVVPAVTPAPRPAPSPAPAPVLAVSSPEVTRQATAGAEDSSSLPFISPEPQQQKQQPPETPASAVPVSQDVEQTPANAATTEAEAAEAKTPAPQATSTTPSETPKAPKETTTKTTTIEIKTQVDTYHVHRYFLGYGTRRGKYFTQLFKDQLADPTDDSPRVSRFEVEPLAGKAFPDLLDYLYDPRSPLVIETETATALHHLGVQFEMEHLQHYAKQFIQKDLSMQTLDMYYQHAAKIFCDEVILGFIVDFVAQNIDLIGATTNFVKQETDAKLWNATLCNNTNLTLHPTRFDKDLHISKIVANFGMAHKTDDTVLDAHTFQELTNIANFRKVDPSVALDLCDLDDYFNDIIAREEAEEGEGAITPPTTVLSSLQQRSATALAEVWKELDVANVHNEQIQRRKPLFLVDLLGKCLKEAKTENDKLSTGRGSGSGGRAGLRHVRRAASSHMSVERVESA